MRTRLVLAIAGLTTIALAAGATPALTDDGTGTVVATVTAQVPPAPCLQLNVTSVDFGTQPFSDPAAGTTPIVKATPAVHLTSCSTASEDVYFTASDATTLAGDVWQNSASESSTCTIGLNAYKAYWFGGGGGGRAYEPNPDGPLPTLMPSPAGLGTDVTFGLVMPCIGSVGAGEAFSITYSLTAVVE